MQRTKCFNFQINNPKNLATLHYSVVVPFYPIPYRDVGVTIIRLIDCSILYRFHYMLDSLNFGRSDF